MKEKNQGRTPRIDESYAVSAMQVEVLPDYTVTQEQMHEYGYSWDGMLPARIRTARVLCETDVELYKLRSDGTESLVTDGELDDSESLYGVEKPAWEAFINSEAGKAYLTAWHSVAESAGKVVNDEVIYFDTRYARQLSDSFRKECGAIEKALHGEYAPSEEAKPYIDPLLERYHKRFPLDLLFECYGWDYESVYDALAENITDEELRKYATGTGKEAPASPAPISAALSAAVANMPAQPGGASTLGRHTASGNENSNG